MSYIILICSDIDTPLISSALVFLSVTPGITEFETLEVRNPLNFDVDTFPGQLVIQAPNQMASISDFETVLRSVVYSTPRALT